MTGQGTPERAEAGAPSRWHYITLGVVSGAVLAYQIILLRVFAYSHWHHFASLAVSLALLGFGVSGTILTLLGERARRWGDSLFVFGLLAAAAGMIGTQLMNQFLLVRPLFVIWDVRELAKILLLDFAAFLPFLGAALCIGQVFVRWPESTRRLYAVNLMGSGAGSLGATALLAFLPLEMALAAVPAAVMLAAAGMVAVRWNALPRPMAWAAPVLLVVAGGFFFAAPPLPVSDFKRLSYLLDLPDARVVEERHGLWAQTTRVRSDSIRIAPGLSLSWVEVIPSQDALVVDSDRAIPLPAITDWKERYRFLDATLGAAPYQLIDTPRVLVIGLSEWQGHLQALRIDGAAVTLLEQNPRLVSLLREEPFAAEFEALRSGNPRRYLSVTGDRFDLVLVEKAAAGGDAASEEYLLTVQGLEEAFGVLTEEGVLAIPLRLQNPPRYLPRVLATVRAMLDRQGIAEPAAHVMILRSMQEGIVLVSREPPAEERLDRLREFAARSGFDFAALPGLAREDANRFHRMPEPVYFDLAQEFLAPGERIPLAEGLFHRGAATDARPYFWRSVRWPMLPELLDTLGREGLVFIDWSLLMLAVTMVVAGVLAILLILLPLGRLPKGEKPITRPRVFLYFTCLGLGFLLLEMAVFQRAILFFGHPVIAASVVFAVFLVASGVGSLSAPADNRRGPVSAIFIYVLIGTAVAAGALWLGTGWLWALPEWMRGFAIALAVVPLAWALGRPFPWALRRVAPQARMIPWAWGINGFASVLAAPLAAMLSIHWSQPATWLAAVACYVCAWLVAAGWSGERGNS